MRILITGTGNSMGLGNLIAQELLAEGHEVIGTDIKLNPKGDYSEIFMDVSFYPSVENTAIYLKGCGTPVDGIINCAGINKLNYLEDMSLEEFDTLMNVNARSIFYTSKAFLEQLKASKGFICNIVSDASHMPMTASLAYNASKGAAHIMTLQLARELTRRHGISVFGISPRKLSGTGMSDVIASEVERVRGWSPEEVAKNQLGVSLTGRELDPQHVAELLGFILTGRRFEEYTGMVIGF